MRTRNSVVAIACAVGVLAACTAAAEPAATSSAPSAPSATASPSAATPDVVVHGADAPLAVLVQKLYAGKSGVE
ncbi:MAG TPA: hypothetical protein VNN23_12675, partial [Ornithinibacter sp.]|nr:hypothetical protein [Ornithinibacter sp.]